MITDEKRDGKRRTNPIIPVFSPILSFFISSKLLSHSPSVPLSSMSLSVWPPLFLLCALCKFCLSFPIALPVSYSLFSWIFWDPENRLSCSFSFPSKLRRLLSISWAYWLLHINTSLSKAIRHLPYDYFMNITKHIRTALPLWYFSPIVFFPLNK